MNGELFSISFFLTLILCAFWKFRYRISQYLSSKKQLSDPKKWKKSIVTASDANILMRSKALLSKEAAWSKNTEGHCVSGESLSLYCALALAAKEIKGTFDINATYAQAVILSISSQYTSRLGIQNNQKYWNTNLIFLFNNHPQTQHQEILSVLDEAIIELDKVKLRGFN